MTVDSANACYDAESYPETLGADVSLLSAQSQDLPSNLSRDSFQLSLDLCGSCLERDAQDPDSMIDRRWYQRPFASSKRGKTRYWASLECGSNASKYPDELL